MRVKFISLVAIIICLISVLCACDKQNEYYSNDVDLHAIAVNSLLGVSTRETDRVLVLETDDFGRKLFAFKAYTCNGTKENGDIFAVFVSQKTKDGKAYFYDNVDCLYCPAPSSFSYKQFTEQSEQVVKSCFTDEQISSLKEVNDWDKPLNPNKFFEVKVNTRNKDTVSEFNRYKAFLMIGTDEEYKNSCIVSITTDKNGKSIYYVRVKPKESKRGDYVFSNSYVIMFDKHGNVDRSKGIMEIKDVWNYQEQLASFKAANDWNK